MMVEQRVRVGMPLADFIEQYSRQPFELVNGEVVKLSPNVVGQQLVVQTLFLALHAFNTTKQLGRIAIDTPFVLKDDPDWVKGSRTPDLALYTSERWSAYVAATPDWKEKPYILVPDLAIEIVSPNDRYTDIQDKIDGYLADGVRLVWLVDPQRRKVVIYTPDSDQQLTPRETDALSAGDVLPGFSILVKSIFE